MHILTQEDELPNLIIRKKNGIAPKFYAYMKFEGNN